MSWAFQLMMDYDCVIVPLCRHKYCLPAVCSLCPLIRVQNWNWRSAWCSAWYSRHLVLRVPARCIIMRLLAIERPHAGARQPETKEELQGVGDCSQQLQCSIGACSGSCGNQNTRINSLKWPGRDGSRKQPELCGRCRQPSAGHGVREQPAGRQTHAEGTMCFFFCFLGQLEEGASCG